MALPGLTVNYEDHELRCLAALAEWAWAGAGAYDWTIEHRKTLDQAVDFAYKPLQDAIRDALLRLTGAGCGDFTVARLYRVEAAGKIGIREAATQILASGGDQLILRATLERIAVKRIAGPTVQGVGRFSAFGYLERAAGTGLTRQRARALRGQRIFVK